MSVTEHHLEVGGHRRQLLRLHAEDHDVLHARLGHAAGGLHVARDLLGAVVADELEAVGPDRGKVWTARDEGDVFAR